MARTVFRAWPWLAAALFALPLVGCAPQERVEVQAAGTGAPAPAPVPLAVALARPQPGPLFAQRRVAVTLEPRRRSAVAATASGRVLEVTAQEGDALAEGAVVVRLDPAAAADGLRDAELALAQARIQRQQAGRAQGDTLASLREGLRAAEESERAAAAQLAQAQALEEVGAVSRLELGNLRAQAAGARAQRAQAQAALGGAERAPAEDLALLDLGVRQAEARVSAAARALRDTEVRAPYAGVLVRRAVNEGEFLAAGAPAFVLADTSVLEARFGLPPAEAATLPGALVLEYGGREYSASPLRSGALPGEGGLVEVVARVDGADVPPGASATLRYRAALGEGGVLVPVAALRREANGVRVFVAEGGVARAVPVTVLAEAGGQAAVRGAPGAVVSPLSAALQSGDPVTVLGARP